MKRVLLCILLIIFCVSWISSRDSIENLSRYFNGFNGCFILYDESKNESIIYNESKSTIRVSPCSSFKIIHSLIGLETKVLQDEFTEFKWDGTKYSIPEWNKDQTLASAVTYSVVWYFQKVASKVGKEKERYYLENINYGNKDLSGDITNFWLESSLKISPKEQIEILKNFYHYQLPFSRSNIDIVKKILVLSQKNGITFSGKTGSGSNNNKAVNGWFVGYVEKDKKIYYFAANIEGEDGATGYKAKEITQNILKDKNLF